MVENNITIIHNPCSATIRQSADQSIDLSKKAELCTFVATVVAGYVHSNLVIETKWMRHFSGEVRWMVAKSCTS